MPKAYQLAHAIMRGLRSPTVLKLVQKGVEAATPALNELIVRQTENLRDSSFAPLAQAASTAARGALEKLPGQLAEARRAAKKALAAEEPYNHEPNATFPDPKAAYRAMSMLGTESSEVPGSGMLVYGNDQPFLASPGSSVKISGRTPSQKEKNDPSHPINTYATPPMSQQNTFGYIGWPGAASQLANPRYSVAGQYFRKTGPGTDTGSAMPAYGIDAPQPRPKLPRRIRAAPEIIAPIERARPKRTRRMKVAV